LPRELRPGGLVRRGRRDHVAVPLVLGGRGTTLLRHRRARLDENPAKLVALDDLDGEEARGDLAERFPVAGDDVASWKRLVITVRCRR